MDDILLQQTIERYLEGKMLPEEKAFFEQHRKNVPEIDQMVVEHSMFLHQMEDFAANHNLKHSLHEAHAKLLANGDINEGGILTTKGKVVKMWARYRKVTAIAAVVGGAIAFMISGLVAFFAPINESKIQQLIGEVNKVKNTQRDQNNKLNEVESKLPKDAIFTGSGTGFLVDAKGYIITNAHVLKGSSFANVINSKGERLIAKIIFSDEQNDLSILKITDSDFKPAKNLPYSIRRANVDLGEEIFTLGYPRNEIVSNIGYLSARTGFNGDTASFQIQMSAHPGNSGGPVLNKNGEVIGVLSKREKQVEGVAFAIKSKNIYQLLTEAEKSDTSFQKIKMSNSSSIKGLDRVAQIKQVEDCVFLIQAYNNKK